MLKYLRIAAVLAVALDFICPSHGFLTGDSEAGAIVPGNVAIATPVAPTGPGSTTPTMMGLGYAGEFMPRGDGIALIMISGTVSTATAASDGATMQIVYGQGAAPVNTGAFTGTACGAAITAQNGTLASNVSNGFPFTAVCIATGMQLGAPYWIDMASARVGAGTVTFSNITVVAAEQ